MPESLNLKMLLTFSLSLNRKQKPVLQAMSCGACVQKCCMTAVKIVTPVIRHI